MLEPLAQRGCPLPEAADRQEHDPNPKNDLPDALCQPGLVENILSSAHPALTMPLLQKIGKNSEKGVPRLCWFAFGAEENDWVFDHDPKVFMEGILQQYKAMGSRLTKLRIPANCKLDWQKQGCYRWVATGGALKLAHVGGVQVVVGGVRDVLYDTSLGNFLRAQC